MKSTSVSYVRNTLISLLNIVEKSKNIYANVNFLLLLAIKNQSFFGFSEIWTLKKTYRFGRSIELCVRSVNLDNFRTMSSAGYNFILFYAFFSSKTTVSMCNKTHFGHDLISVEAIKEPCVLGINNMSLI